MRKDARNLAGMRFEHLLVLSPTRNERGHLMWLCLCDCGKQVLRLSGNLRKRYRQSCGCMTTSGDRHPMWKGGVTRNSAHGLFNTMKQRCLNPNSQKYPAYGGEGIEFRFSSFEEFMEEIGPRPSLKHSVDRKDPLGHYERGNVRWATAVEQNRNRRGTRIALRRGDILGMLRAPLSFGA